MTVMPVIYQDVQRYLRLCKVWLKYCLSAMAGSDFAVKTLESAELEAIRNMFATNLLLCVKRKKNLDTMKNDELCCESS